MATAHAADAKDLNWYIGYDGDLGEVLAKIYFAKGLVFIAEEEGRKVGFLRLELLGHRVVIVSEIQIYKDYRGKDVGATLLKAAEDALRAKGYKHLLCLSNADIEAPRLWYEMMGFKEAGELADLDGNGTVEVAYCKAL